MSEPAPMPMDYPTAYAIHVGSVSLSLGWFLVRAIWMLRENPLLATRFHASGPHVVDSVLLASGAYLAWMLHQIPFEADWLTTKLFVLLVYIVSGAIALKRGRTRPIRMAALAVAILSAGYILAIALTRDPRLIP